MNTLMNIIIAWETTIQVLVWFQWLFYYVLFKMLLDWVDCFLFDCSFVSLCFLSHFILYFILKNWLRVGLCFHNASARRNALDLWECHKTKSRRFPVVQGIVYRKPPWWTCWFIGAITIINVFFDKLATGGPHLVRRKNQVVFYRRLLTNQSIDCLQDVAP